MRTRRAVVLGGTLFVASAPAIARNTLGEVLKAGPKPKLIKGINGEPDKVDFSHGLLVPMNKEAFHALWEGDDRWIAYGHGFGHNKVSAMAQAERSASGTMKLYLLTLAFTPERLERIDGGGWRLKSGNTKDLVKGNIDLPGRPIMPTTDTVSGTWAGAGGDAGGGIDASPSNTSASGEEATHATTGWLIWKREVSLDDVRRKAVLLGG